MIGAATVPWAGCRSAAVSTPEPAAAGAPLDAALSTLSATDPEFRGGLSNHGPMASEALEALGHPDRIPAFVEFYRGRLDPRPAAAPLSWSQWSAARGRPEMRGALLQTFEDRVAQVEPESLIAEVFGELAPGIAAAAFHGLLRTAHAWRGWGRHPSAPRRREVAHGLGYFASRYQTLPGEPGARAQPGLDAAAALQRVPIIDPDQRLTAGLILDRFAVLEGHAGFIGAVEAFDPAAQAPAATVDALSLAAATAYLGASNGRDRFVLLHGVTGSAALRHLLPALSAEQQQRAAAYLFQALAAVVATHGESGGEPPAPPEQTPRPAELAAAAADSRDDHTIKLVEAALAQWSETAEPVFLTAAARQLRLA